MECKWCKKPLKNKLQNMSETVAYSKEDVVLKLNWFYRYMLTELTLISEMSDIDFEAHLSIKSDLGWFESEGRDIFNEMVMHIENLKLWRSTAHNTVIGIIKKFEWLYNWHKNHCKDMNDLIKLVEWITEMPYWLKNRVLSVKNDTERAVMTYGELYELFVSRNPVLSKYFIDYRPYGEMALEIWTTNGMSIKIKYNLENDVFEIVDNAV